MASTGISQTPKTPPPTSPASKVEVGRYQIFLYQGESPRLNTYLLDTATGKVWMMTRAPDGSTFWTPVEKVDNDTENDSYLERHKSDVK